MIVPSFVRGSSSFTVLTRDVPHHRHRHLRPSHRRWSEPTRAPPWGRPARMTVARSGQDDQSECTTLSLWRLGVGQRAAHQRRRRCRGRIVLLFDCAPVRACGGGVVAQLRSGVVGNGGSCGCRLEAAVGSFRMAAAQRSPKVIGPPRVSPPLGARGGVGRRTRDGRENDGQTTGDRRANDERNVAASTARAPLLLEGTTP